MTDTPSHMLDDWVGGFNPKQTEAYEFDGHCGVLAGPGSGKTRVLVARVARLMDQRAKGPRGVVCITFNNEAVRELQKRLGQLGLRSSRRLFIGTVHSFCLACIVASFGHLFRADLKMDFAVAGLRQRKQVLESALASLGLPVSNVTDWQTRFDRYRRTHPLRDSTQWCEDSELAMLIETYECLLHDQGLLDYDDMVLISLDLLRHNEFVRSAIEARFPFLVVDEYQDLGFPLHLIVQLLMRKTSIEVFAVGDPDQSIYGFTGSDPMYLREFAEDSGVHRVELDMNYRSVQRIIDGSQIALAPEKPRNFRSAREGEVGELSFVKCPEGLGQQAHLIATEFIPAIKLNGTSSDQIAILYIDKWDQLVLSKSLTEVGVKYAGERDQRYPRTPFTRWLEDIAAWCSLFPDTQQGPEFGELFNRFVEISEDAGIPVNTGELSSRTAFFEAMTHIALPETHLVEWLQQLDQELNLETCLESRKRHPDDYADWMLIKKSCQEGEALAGFSLEDFARCGGMPDTVTLTTLHSSKGREYEVVIIPGLEEGRLPGYRAKSTDALAEARRVFYVGMTRAKDTVFLLYSGWYKNRYGRIFNHGPSRFVEELQTNMHRLT